MSKLIGQQVRVRLNEVTQLPSIFWWKGSQQRISGLLHFWKEASAWWEGQGERLHYNVVTERGGFYELVFDAASQAWELARHFD